jgi:hypothetical protein
MLTFHRGHLLGVSSILIASIAPFACSSSSTPATAGGDASTTPHDAGSSCSFNPASVPNASDAQCAPPQGTTGNATIDASVSSCSAPGEATPGAADKHCDQPDGSLMIQSTSPSACCVAGDAGGPGTCPYDVTMYGHEGDDDDCKYHVTWSSTAICPGCDGVEFTVVATYLGTDNPVTGAHVHPEVFTTTPGDASCDDMSTHESPSTFEVMTEDPPGTYTGRIIFDQSGQWTVRFHFNENCYDVLPNSPHGHAAFHITVP